MNIEEESLSLHSELGGKMQVQPKRPIQKMKDLALLYSPGVAEPCRKIAKDTEKVWEYTGRWNSVAVVSDGTAVLGLGDIGPEAALPVMEGKSLLFKEFGNVDAFSLVLNTTDVDEIVETVARLEPGLGGVNLEDISAPRCFEIERQLKERMSIPVFHDDQHGTAIVVLAGLINAAKITGRAFETMKVVMSGAGAAGIAIVQLLRSQGIEHIIACDSQGIISSDRENLNESKQMLLEMTNTADISGTLADAMNQADVFIGVSVGGIVDQDMVRSMATDPIIFAMANPTPEIMPDEARAAGAAIVATGRSDYPNQVNNVLAFPGIFRGALDARATRITAEMNLAAAHAIANYVTKPSTDEIVPSPLDKGLATVVAVAVQEAAQQ